MKRFEYETLILSGEEEFTAQYGLSLPSCYTCMPHRTERRAFRIFRFTMGPAQLTALVKQRFIGEHRNSHSLSNLTLETELLYHFTEHPLQQRFTERQKNTVPLLGTDTESARNDPAGHFAHNRRIARKHQSAYFDAFQTDKIDFLRRERELLYRFEVEIRDVVSNEKIHSRDLLGIEILILLEGLERREKIRRNRVALETTQIENGIVSAPADLNNGRTQSIG